MTDADCTPGREPRSVAASSNKKLTIIGTTIQLMNLLTNFFWLTVYTYRVIEIFQYKEELTALKQLIATWCLHSQSIKTSYSYIFGHL